MGWLNYGNSAPILTVSGSGTYTIAPYAAADSGSKALKIQKSVDASTGAKTWYYLEFRGYGGGFDANLSGGITGGVLLHTGSEATGNSSNVLDMTPETDSWYDASLPVGRTYTDSVAGITITPLSLGSGGATVMVQFDQGACVPAAPTVTVTPAPSQWAVPGATVRWTLSVVNHDSVACGTSSFQVSAALPSDLWRSVTSPAILQLGPSGTGTATVDVTSAPSAADSFYGLTFGVTRLDGRDAASAPATYVVASTLSVGVSTAAATYSRNQTVKIAAVVSSAGSPASGVPVTITVKSSNGSTAKSTVVTTDVSGKASFSYKLAAKPAAGTWTVTAAASFNGVKGQALTTFAVK
jgi:hypothetical protein